MKIRLAVSVVSHIFIYKNCFSSMLRAILLKIIFPKGIDIGLWNLFIYSCRTLGLNKLPQKRHKTVFSTLFKVEKKYSALKLMKTVIGTGEGILNYFSIQCLSATYAQWIGTSAQSRASFQSHSWGFFTKKFSNRDKTTRFDPPLMFLTLIPQLLNRIGKQKFSQHGQRPCNYRVKYIQPIFFSCFGMVQYL